MARIAEIFVLELSENSLLASLPLSAKTKGMVLLGKTTCLLFSRQR
jgi:hypothetical protein